MHAVIKGKCKGSKSAMQMEETHVQKIFDILKKYVPKIKLAKERLNGEVFYNDLMNTRSGMLNSLVSDAPYLQAILRYQAEPLKSVLQSAVQHFYKYHKLCQDRDKEFFRRQAFGLKQQLIAVRKASSRVKNGA